MRMTPQSFRSWLDKSDRPGKQATLLNKDDWPFIQYRLQSLLFKRR